VSPSLETEWLHILQNRLYVRSLFEPTEVVSLYVYTGRDLVAIPFELIPRDKFKMGSFFVSSSVKGTQYNLVLECRTYKHVVEGNVRATFRIKWKRIRYSERKLGYDFIYGPLSVLVCVPTTPSSALAPGVNPELFQDCRYWDDTSTLPSLYSNFLNRRVVLDKVSRPVSGQKNGFSGLPKASGNKVTLDERFDAQYSNLSPPIVPLGVPYKVEVFSRTILGTTTPGFRTKAKANLPINPLQISIVSQNDGPCQRGLIQVDHSPGGTTLNRRTYCGRSTGTFFNSIAVSGFDSNLKNAALDKLEAKAGVNITANLAQDFLQFGQLKRLIAGNFSSITRASELSRRGQMRAAANELFRGASIPKVKDGKPTTNLTIIAARWLELQYGWKILMKEIEDLLKAMARNNEHKPPVKRVRVRSRRRKNFSNFQGPWTVGLEKGELQVIEEQYCTIGIRYQHSPTFNLLLQQTGWLNGINLAWELLPYSFVADWALPIGPYLQSLNVWSGMVFKDGFITQFVRSRQQGIFDGSVTSTVGSTTVTHSVIATYSCTKVNLQREILTDFPMKDLPRFRDPASLTHALNALALLKVRFR